MSDCFIEIEKDLDDVLRKGDLDAIDQKVTPKILARCKTNTLLKSFQVGLVTIFANFTGYILVFVLTGHRGSSALIYNRRLKKLSGHVQELEANKKSETISLIFWEPFDIQHNCISI